MPFRNNLLILPALLLSIIMNCISVASCFKGDDWMSEMYAHLCERKIYEIFLPGTHHSAYQPSQQPFASLTSSFTKCQDKTIAEQLNDGIRFFDLRITLSSTLNELVISHFFSSDILLADILVIIRNFLQLNPKELVVLLVREDYDSPISEEWKYKAHAIILQHFNGLIISSEHLNSPYKDLLHNGQVIMSGLVEDDAACKVYWPYQVSWHDTRHQNAAVMIEKTCTFVQSLSSAEGGSKLTVCDVVVTIGKDNFFNGIRGQAEKVNAAFTDALQKNLFQGQIGSFFMFDFYDPIIIQKIIELNRLNN